MCFAKRLPNTFFSSSKVIKLQQHTDEVFSVSQSQMFVKHYLWFGDEGPSGDGEAVMDSAEILSHDGKTTPLFAACAGRQPLDGKNNCWKLLKHIKRVLKMIFASQTKKN